MSASLLLMTSSYEGFSYVILEAQQAGVPCVLYDMPYLELLRSGRGYVAVEQEDVVSAANAVVEILQSPEWRRRLGREAMENFREFTAVDPGIQWKALLDSIERNEPPPEELPEVDPKELRILLQTLLQHGIFGHVYLHQIMKQEKEAILASRAYRLGNRMLWLPRKLRGGLRCLNENGLKYTFRRLFEKLKRRK